MCKNRIYLSQIDPALSRDTYNKLLQMISKENREKCRRFRFKEDSLRTLYGELMLRYVLWRQFSLENEAVEILKGDEGKPYLKDCPIHFNISHAADFVVCAVSEQAIGVDIEQIKETDLSLAKRFFCQCEYEDLIAQHADDRLDYFFSLWTLKESYMKWLGSGMAIPLDSFFFKITDEGISVVDENREIRPFFKQFSVDDYKISLCSMIDSFSDEIEKINVEEMVFWRGLTK
ncbi:MAG: 4'-phosphopantetheinyl transferase superfamily protein [Oscillospiraceae bacterium]|nr:4'-phosphopantetheinyl transferase superfamily protein [Oscillospiraceae bacterium]